MARPVPKEIAVAAGDVLFQLRSALDLLTCELARRNGKTNTGGTYFPFAGDPQEFELPATQKKINKLSPLNQNRIRALRPYKGGNDLLWSLNALCNRDKHNSLVGMCGAAGGWAYIRLNRPAVVVPFPPVWDAAKEEMVMVRGPAGFQPDGEMEPTLGIAFREVKVVEGQPIVAALAQFGCLVEKIVSAFEAAA